MPLSSFSGRNTVINESFYNASYLVRQHVDARCIGPVFAYQCGLNNIGSELPDGYGDSKPNNAKKRQQISQTFGRRAKKKLYFSNMAYKKPIWQPCKG